MIKDSNVPIINGTMASMAEYSESTFVQSAFYQDKLYAITTNGILATFSIEKKLHLWVDLKVIQLINIVD